MLFHDLQLSGQPVLNGRSYQRQAMARRRKSFSLLWERPWLPHRPSCLSLLRNRPEQQSLRRNSGACVRSFSKSASWWLQVLR
jgi:hypothetical protein